ncbi:helix-turn-helix domain-containing protein [Phytomonospora endophytica]|uniref:AraC-like DNA-binding protein n=1 Tax=Phytomonospora endophytica TaxID=714109 RepID=A0A841FVV7_9ACTN|nr:AraC family transcriptional regulator [Phytomonospora endophytica]MBB6037467.1 AraC-like DNA-binding protein [Phytomonospora endophytica]GIG70717.1 AraC family transcriptional regulator [Phytomonospora endophytica]
MYREAPSAVIPEAVVWRRSAITGTRPSRILPDGCLDIIWSNDHLFVAGPDTTAQLSQGVAGQRYTGLRFAPGIGPAVLGLPASELTDRRVALADILPPALVDEAVGRIHDGADAGVVLEALAAARMRLGDGPDPLMRAVAARLREGDTVAGTALAVNLGERHLRRRALAAFGYGPKTLARILRLGRALDLARGGVPYAHVAATTGYTDQAHLSREVKALAGAPLGVVLG